MTRLCLLSLLALPLILLPATAAPPGKGPVLVVEASYSGANAPVVADTVAAPIEQQVRGLAGLLSMRSRSTHEGTYVLTLAFKNGTNAEEAVAGVRKRLALAEPLLPDLVRRRGTTVKRQAAPPRLVAVLSSPDGSHDLPSLRRYAAGTLQRELAGLAEVTLLEALRDGKAVLALALAPGPGTDHAKARQQLDRLRARLPKGMALAVPFDFDPAAARLDYLRIDVRLPDAASLHRTQEMLSRCAKMARVDGVADVLALAGRPLTSEENRGWLLVRLAPAKGRASRERIAGKLRSMYHKEIATAIVRVCELTGAGPFPPGGYALDLAVVDGADRGTKALIQAAEGLADALRESGKVTDAADERPANVSRVALTINRAKANKLGVSTSDIAETLKVYLGSEALNELNRFGRAAPGAPGLLREFPHLKVRNRAGKMVPLAALGEVREVSGPLVVERFDGTRMVRVTANLAPEVTMREARALVERLARRELPKGTRWAWLEE